MKKTITTKTYVSPFLRMKAAYIDWTGYDAALIEEACDKGLELEEENKRFRDFSPKEARQRFWSNWGTFGYVVVVLIVIALFTLGIVAIGDSGWYSKGYNAGRQEAVSSAIAFVEARYRHVNPLQIKLEFPNGTEIFTLKDYVKSKGHDYDELPENPSWENGYSKKGFQKEYNDLVASGGIYRIFVEPTTGMDDPRK
jgi:hypothetical protein